jgi:hypothetical protein
MKLQLERSRFDGERLLGVLLLVAVLFIAAVKMSAELKENPKNPNNRSNNNVSNHNLLLRVKRKRDEVALNTLLLQAEDNYINNINQLLSNTNIEQDKSNSKLQQDDNVKSTAQAMTRRVFKLIATEEENKKDFTSKIRSGIQELREKRLIKKNNNLENIDLAKENALAQSIQRNLQGRKSKIDSQRRITVLEEFNFIDVELPLHKRKKINEQKKLNNAETAEIAVKSSVRRKKKNLTEVAAEDKLIDQDYTAKQFNNAMKIIQNSNNFSDNREQMTAYEELIEDYLQTLPNDTGNQIKQTAIQQNNLNHQKINEVKQTQQLQQLQPIPIGAYLQSNAYHEQHNNNNIHNHLEDADYVYDVYHIIDDDAEQANLGNTEHHEAAAAATNIIFDNRLAGWFGLILNEDNNEDSDEDSEDENRESAESNEYPEEEEENSGDDDYYGDDSYDRLAYQQELDTMKRNMQYQKYDSSEDEDYVQQNPYSAQYNYQL